MKTLFLTLTSIWLIGPLFAQLKTSDRQLLDSLIAGAVEFSPQLNSMAAKLQQDKIKLRSEKSSWLSGLQVGVQFFSLQEQNIGETTTRTAGILPNVGGTLQLNVHKLLTTPQRISMAKQETIRTSESLKANVVDLERWMTLKFYEYIQAREQMTMAQRILQAKKEQEFLTRKKFERGEEKFTALLEVQNAIVQLEETILKHQLGKDRSWEELQIMAGKRELIIDN